MEYILVALLIYSINVVPAFMPPTWIVLSFFFIQFHLLFFPVILIGALCATLGRITLYFLAKTYLHPFLPKPSQKNLDALGTFVNKKKKLSIALFILYAFLPIPSNQVYVAAALAKIRIQLLAISFFGGRLISYSFWVGVSAIGVNSLDLIFVKHFKNPIAIAVQIGGFIVVYYLTKVNWEKILR